MNDPHACNNCERLKDEVAELNATFDLQHDADIRAIQMFKDAHPDYPDDRWPDRAALFAWVALDRDESRADLARKDALLRWPRKWLDGYPAPFDVSAGSELGQMEKFLKGLADLCDAALSPSPACSECGGRGTVPRHGAGAATFRKPCPKCAVPDPDCETCKGTGRVYYCGGCSQTPNAVGQPQGYCPGGDDCLLKDEAPPCPKCQPAPAEPRIKGIDCSGMIPKEGAEIPEVFMEPYPAEGGEGEGLRRGLENLSEEELDAFLNTFPPFEDEPTLQTEPKCTCRCERKEGDTVASWALVRDPMCPVDHTVRLPTPAPREEPT